MLSVVKLTLQCVGAALALAGVCSSASTATLPGTGILTPPPVATPASTPSPAGVLDAAGRSSSKHSSAVFSAFVQKTCPETGCISAGHFLLAFPLPASAGAEVDAAYRYGHTQKQKRPLHHGVDLKAGLGTPVLAAADGRVFFAGEDNEKIYGGEKLDFYGKLIILEHTPGGRNSPLYTLYGHLSEIDVQAGQKIALGQKIGEVGMTGVAIGYHLHFEVRTVADSYDSTQNPELWLKPPAAPDGRLTGVFAGRIVGKDGGPMRISKVVIEKTGAGSDGVQIYLNTYDDPPMPHRVGSRDDSFLMPAADFTLGRDELWQEDFCLGGLAPGKYRISFTSQVVVSRTFEIRPGSVTFLQIKTNE